MVDKMKLELHEELVMMSIYLCILIP